MNEKKLLKKASLFAASFVVAGALGAGVAHAATAGVIDWETKILTVPTGATTYSVDGVNWNFLFSDTLDISNLITDAGRNIYFNNLTDAANTRALLARPPVTGTTFTFATGEDADYITATTADTPIQIRVGNGTWVTSEASDDHMIAVSNIVTHAGNVPVQVRLAGNINTPPSNPITINVGARRIAPDVTWDESADSLIGVPAGAEISVAGGAWLSIGAGDHTRDDINVLVDPVVITNQDVRVRFAATNSLPHSDYTEITDIENNEIGPAWVVNFVEEFLEITNRPPGTGANQWDNTYTGFEFRVNIGDDIGSWNPVFGSNPSMADPDESVDGIPLSSFIPNYNADGSLAVVVEIRAVGAGIPTRVERILLPMRNPAPVGPFVFNYDAETLTGLAVTHEIYAGFDLRARMLPFTWTEVTDANMDFDGLFPGWMYLQVRTAGINGTGGQFASMPTPQIFVSQRAAQPAITHDLVNDRLIGVANGMRFSTDMGQNWITLGGNGPNDFTLADGVNFLTRAQIDVNSDTEIQFQANYIPRGTENPDTIGRRRSLPQRILVLAPAAATNANVADIDPVAETLPNVTANHTIGFAEGGPFTPIDPDLIGDYGFDISAFINNAPALGRTIWISTPSGDARPAGAPVGVEIPARIPAPTIAPFNLGADGFDFNAIAWEWRRPVVGDGFVYADGSASGNAVQNGGLIYVGAYNVAQPFEIRVRATSTQFASQIVRVVSPARAQQPTAVYSPMDDVIRVTLNNVPVMNGEFALYGTNIWYPIVALGDDPSNVITRARLIATVGADDVNIITRIAQQGNNRASLASQPAFVPSIAGIPAPAGITINFADEVLVGTAAGMQLSADSGGTWVNITGDNFNITPFVTPDSGALWVRFGHTADLPAGSHYTINAPARPAAPEDMIFDPAGNAITGLGTTWQFRLGAAGTNWQDLESATLSLDGTPVTAIDFRIPATDTSFASNPSEAIRFAQAPNAPNVQYNNQNHEFRLLTANMQYRFSVDGGLTWRSGIDGVDVNIWGSAPANISTMRVDTRTMEAAIFEFRFAAVGNVPPSLITRISVLEAMPAAEDTAVYTVTLDMDQEILVGVTREMQFRRLGVNGVMTPWAPITTSAAPINVPIHNWIFDRLTHPDYQWIEMRMAPAGNVQASDFVRFVIPRREVTIVPTFNPDDLTIDDTAGMQFRIGTAGIWTNVGGSSLDIELFADNGRQIDLYFRTAPVETNYRYGGVPASVPARLRLSAMAAAPRPLFNANTGALLGVNENMEFSSDGGITWHRFEPQHLTGTTVFNAVATLHGPGQYWIRTRANISGINNNRPSHHVVIAIN
jgi:hypothetical protein